MGKEEPQSYAGSTIITTGLRNISLEIVDSFCCTYQFLYKSGPTTQRDFVSFKKLVP